jgi:hypothetical protein
MIEEKGSEEKLIADLVGRANAQVCDHVFMRYYMHLLFWQVKLQKGTTGYQTAEQISLEQIRKKNEEALIQLSANKLSVIISGLAEGLDALSKVCFLSFIHHTIWRLFHKSKMTFHIHCTTPLLPYSHILSRFFYSFTTLHT